MNLIQALGLVVAADGAGSLLYYEGTQTTWEILVRVVRIAVGLTIFYLAGTKKGRK